MIPPVVDAAFVADHPDVVLADVRWYLDGRDGRAAFEAAHLPGAVFVDLERDLAGHGRPATEGRHPLPEPADFAAAMGALGIGDDTVVVAYDDTGLTAARLVVMLRMLERDAAVLDGGLAAWSGQVQSGPVQSGPSAQRPRATFTAMPWPVERLAGPDDVVAHIAAGGAVLDARAPERFSGAQAMIDPRPGHVPGARNAPWAALLGDDGRLRPASELRDHFAAAGLTAHTSTAITYCGSGVSACMNVIAAEHAGLPVPRLYVASWSGWSADPQRPAATDV
jgi:thiosulfate/3-mercaptopyruvate sulfurtransferase